MSHMLSFTSINKSLIVKTKSTTVSLLLSAFLYSSSEVRQYYSRTPGGSTTREIGS